MEYRTVSEMVKIWNMPERSIRNYCEGGKIQGVIRDGRRWLIPENAQAPVKFGNNPVVAKNLKVEKTVNQQNISGAQKEEKGVEKASKKIATEVKADTGNEKENKTIVKEKVVKKEKIKVNKLKKVSKSSKIEEKSVEIEEPTGFANLDRILLYEKDYGITRGFYGDLISFFIYHANKANGNKLSLEDIQTIIFDFDDRLIKKSVKILDFLDTVNLAECFNLTLENLKTKLTVKFLLNYEKILNNGKQSILGKQNRTKAKENELSKLIEKFNKKEVHSIDDLAEFHYNFIKINYFEENNEKIAKLILLKESLGSGITPVVMYDKLNYFYNRGMVEWTRQPMFLKDTFRNYQENVNKMISKYNFKRK